MSIYPREEEEYSRHLYIMNLIGFWWGLALILWFLYVIFLR